MKLYEVIFTDEAYDAEIVELVVANTEDEATEKAWNKYYNSRGRLNKPLKDQHSLQSVSELNEVDGYSISINNFNEYETLVESSNAHHNAFYDYLEKYGMDNRLEVHMIGMHRWLELNAKKHGIEL